MCQHCTMNITNEEKKKPGARIENTLLSYIGFMRRCGYSDIRTINSAVYFDNWYCNTVACYLANLFRVVDYHKQRVRNILWLFFFHLNTIIIRNIRVFRGPALESGKRLINKFARTPAC